MSGAMAYFHFDRPEDLDRFCVHGIDGVDDFGRPYVRGGVLIGQDPHPAASDRAELADIEVTS